MSIVSSFFLALIIIPFTDSLSFNFTNITQRNSQDFILSGDAAFNYGIELTHERNNNRAWLVGRATYIRPLQLWNKNSTDLASFSTSFTILIASYPNQSYGDGLTFFLGQNNSMLVSGGSLGLPFLWDAVTTPFPFVAVEFDTFCNPQKDPLDPLTGQCIGEHVGIDVNSITSVASRKWYTNITHGKDCRVLIQYHSDTKILSVSFTSFRNNTPEWETGLNHTVDLRALLPESVVVGFSAATGGLYQKNIVRSWTFNSTQLNRVPKNAFPKNVVPNPNNAVSNAAKGKHENWLMVLVAGPLVLVTLLY